ncbi:cytochrome P450 [Dermatobacter hominis]|uniref:cytochrome P450 n=1 Tax=Dermatobacter hominis TaxID=2884263 RepID=UPI001D0F7A0B|nr:cytochrome P450 [Dermatobacter hominis]UDY34669.1 cytochrome P450 [Dermatobacter hominis]
MTTIDPIQLSEVDLLDLDAFVAGRHHAMFQVLRAEDPVHWAEEPDGPGFWSVTKHADLQMVNRDTALFSSQAGSTQRLDPDPDSGFDTRGVLLLDSDPPIHTRYRRLVNKGFTPRMIGLLEQHLRYRAELIVDDVIEAGECEFVTDLAAELPLQAIAEIMGVPQEDRRLMFEWSNAMIGSQDPEYQDPDDPNKPQTAAAEIFAYSNQLAARRREDPRDDIVTKLLNTEIEGERLSELEFDMFMLLLTVAGNETTRNATSAGMWALLTHQEQLAKLIANADDETYVSTAIDEVLRWSSPVMHFRRTAMEDTEIRGREIKQGDKVLIWHISANRDEEVFEDPFRFDLERRPNEHVAFGGGGAHYCLGANLAKLELEIIFAEVLSRMPDIAATGPAEMLRSNFIGGVKHLPVRFTPGRRKHPTQG